jgi:hypothetical protein
MSQTATNLVSWYGQCHKDQECWADTELAWPVASATKSNKCSGAGLAWLVPQ